MDNLDQCKNCTKARKDGRACDECTGPEYDKNVRRYGGTINFDNSKYREDEKGDYCPKCGGRGKLFRMSCICPDCGFIIWGA